MISINQSAAVRAAGETRALFETREMEELKRMFWLLRYFGKRQAESCFPPAVMKSEVGGILQALVFNI